MALEGRLRLDLSRKGQVVKRVEKKNTITSLFQNAVLEGDFQYLCNRSKIVPELFFDGCLLTDKANNANLSMIAGDSEIIAQAGNNTYTGTNSKRGSYIPLESSHFTSPTDGFTKVWRWDNASGNGRINSVCLCPSAIGIFDFAENTTPPDGNPPNYPLGFSTSGSIGDDVYPKTIGHLTIVDYNRGVGYYLTAKTDLTEIYLDEFEVSTTRVRLLSSPDYVVSQIGSRHTYTINGGLPNPSVSYTGDAIHIMSFENRTINSVPSVVLRDLKIDVEDLTNYTELASHTYSDVTLCTYRGGIQDFEGNILLVKDLFVYDDTNKYVYNLGYVNSVGKMLRFNISQDSNQVKAYDVSFAPPLDGESGIQNNGASILLDNGDFFKTNYLNMASGNYIYYYHNDKVYAVAPVYRQGSEAIYSVNGGKGTVFFLTNWGKRAGTNRVYTELNLFYPYVSTVANLDEEVNKTYDTDMTLTYTVREV